MKKIALEKYVDLGEEIRHAAVGLDLAEGGKWEPAASDTDGAIFDSMMKMREFCKVLGARHMKASLDARLNYNTDAELDRLKPKSWEELYTFVDAFKKELEDRLFLYMPAEDAEYYRSNRLLSAKAKDAFPKLAQEVRNAGTAYACNLPTASVFHCMRALEHALGALARDVGLTWTKEQWHNIIQLIESRIDNERNTLPMGLAKDERLKFLSESAKEFFYFKDGWRNYVAHNRITYEGSQALEVLEHVRAFAEKLAEHLRE